MRGFQGRLTTVVGEKTLGALQELRGVEVDLHVCERWCDHFTCLLGHGEVGKRGHRQGGRELGAATPLSRGHILQVADPPPETCDVVTSCVPRRRGGLVFKLQGSIDVALQCCEQSGRPDVRREALPKCVHVRQALPKTSDVLIEAHSTVLDHSMEHGHRMVQQQEHGARVPMGEQNPVQAPASSINDRWQRPFSAHRNRFQI
mmetsp:Transcript_16957/g.59294  ORF Transcript_16957/g.59294 Transcript_16957/m.59294 type:complete len:203 (+) Transcript_16957:1484-2092(+)